MELLHYERTYCITFFKLRTSYNGHGQYTLLRDLMYIVFAFYLKEIQIVSVLPFGKCQLSLQKVWFGVQLSVIGLPWKHTVPQTIKYAVVFTPPTKKNFAVAEKEVRWQQPQWVA